MLRRERQHLRLHRIVRDQRQRLRFQRMEAIRAGVRREAGVDALHLDPVVRRSHRRQEGFAVDHALALERGRLRKIEEGSTGSIG